MLPQLRSWIRFSRKQQSALFVVMLLQCIGIGWSDYSFNFPALPNQGIFSVEVLDINTADSTEWESFPGIGPVLSSRIVRYRNRVGCFHQLEDLLQVYGIKAEWLNRNQKRLEVSECLQKPKKYKKIKYRWRPNKSAQSFVILRPEKQINLNEMDSIHLGQYNLVPEWILSALLKERTKLGCFTGWVQVQRVWGMSPNWMDSLQAWTYLGACPASLIPQRKIYPKKEVRVDLNLSDSMAFRKIPGIKSSLVGRILRFRAKMRFFHFYDQVLEMKNPPEPDEWAKVLPYFDRIQLEKLPDSVFIYVNREEKETLGRHPYIGYSLAERIVNYRLHHGKFVSLESLSKIYGVKPGTWEKLRPYIRYE